jgi:hypothetical protein
MHARGFDDFYGFCSGQLQLRASEIEGEGAIDFRLIMFKRAQ